MTSAAVDRELDRVTGQLRIMSLRLRTGEPLNVDRAYGEAIAILDLADILEGVAPALEVWELRRGGTALAQAASRQKARRRVGLKAAPRQRPRPTPNPMPTVTEADLFPQRSRTEAKLRRWERAENERLAARARAEEAERRRLVEEHARRAGTSEEPVWQQPWWRRRR